MAVTLEWMFSRKRAREARGEDFRFVLPGEGGAWSPRRTESRHRSWDQARSVGRRWTF